MSDPVTSAAVAAARFVGEKAISYLAMKVYEGSPCASPEQLTAIPKLFCMAVRGAAGVDEKEYRQHLTQQIDLIAERLGRVEQAKPQQWQVAARRAHAQGRLERWRCLVGDKPSRVHAGACRTT